MDFFHVLHKLVNNSSSESMHVLSCVKKMQYWEKEKKRKQGLA
jgi:hypothetical protein